MTRASEASVNDQPYLGPYLRAASEHGAGFESLLWASRETQRTRFDALLGMHPADEKIVLDAGCGRADYLSFLRERGVYPRAYVGLEAVETLTSAARQRRLPNCTIVQGDFVYEPARLFVGAELILFCGSLNTLGDDEFFKTVRYAYDAAGEALAFNFLCSPLLAGRDYLFWRRRSALSDFIAGFCDDVVWNCGYMSGDATVCLRKPRDDRKRG